MDTLIPAESPRVPLFAAFQTFLGKADVSREVEEVLAESREHLSGVCAGAAESSLRPLAGGHRDCHHGLLPALWPQHGESWWPGGHPRMTGGIRGRGGSGLGPRMPRFKSQLCHHHKLYAVRQPCNLTDPPQFPHL